MKLFRWRRISFSYSELCVLAVSPYAKTHRARNLLVWIAEVFSKAIILVVFCKGWFWVNRLGSFAMSGSKLPLVSFTLVLFVWHRNQATWLTLPHLEGWGLPLPRETFLNNSVTPQDITMKFFKFNITPLGGHFAPGDDSHCSQVLPWQLFVMNVSRNGKETCIFRGILAWPCSS